MKDLEKLREYYDFVNDFFIKNKRIKKRLMNNSPYYFYKSFDDLVYTFEARNNFDKFIENEMRNWGDVSFKLCNEIFEKYVYSEEWLNKEKFWNKELEKIINK